MFIFKFQFWIKKYKDTHKNPPGFVEFEARKEAFEKNFHELKLPDDRIKLVATREQVIQFLNDLEELLSTLADDDYLYVGVDSEWKPTCIAGGNAEDRNRVALIQVSTRTHVYLIDLVCMKFEEKDSQLFAQKFLYNKKIVKLGYGFTHDIKLIIHSFTGLHETDLFRSTVIDLAYLINHVIFYIETFFV